MVKRIVKRYTPDDKVLDTQIKQIRAIQDMYDQVREVVDYLNDPKFDINHKGEKRDKGEQGEVGVQGIPGQKGERGPIGPRGPRGMTGETGPVGPVGPKGDTGAQGPEGPQGQQGIQGEKGDKGDKGDQGNPGTNGTDGTNGQDGITPHIDSETKHWMIGSTDTGILAEGKDGQDGQDGTNGTDGAPGVDGVTPHIDSVSGNWFIGSQDTGVHAQGPQGVQGVQGNPGTNGTNGQDGAAATIQVGTVTTGPAGSQASVNNSGTSSAAVLNFVIPKGDKGDTGEYDPNFAAIMAFAVDSNAGTITVTTNPEWKLVLTDNEDRILCGKRQDNTWYFGTTLDVILDCIINGYSTT